MSYDEPATIVRTLRQALGLTQEQFAAEIGVTVSTVNRWENGRTRPQPLAMRRITELQNHMMRKKT
jgi:putative transcriptional regulator